MLSGEKTHGKRQKMSEKSFESQIFPSGATGNRYSEASVYLCYPTWFIGQISAL
ncbi:MULTISPECIES: hypothetical protein [Photorhabdus]|uniref:hypothetical protein n=1 Tax=Photorhabdus TaxID=29487 RepID=UPI00223E8145|nr:MULTISPECIES: hypothetical protein [Photorhabdus]MCW7546821.1 hypothetical protein [Photorhabdus aballayi]MCW7761411.1 hypothetical protein [Photorhabdus luminescens subsp. venezuelensis]